MKWKVQKKEKKKIYDIGIEKSKHKKRMLEVEIIKFSLKKKNEKFKYRYIIWIYRMGDGGMKEMLSARFWIFKFTFELLFCDISIFFYSFLFPSSSSFLRLIITILIASFSYSFWLPTSSISHQHHRHCSSKCCTIQSKLIFIRIEW